MIKMNINLGDDFLDAEIRTLESINIRVGILDKNKASKLPKSKSAPLKVVGTTGKMGRRIKGNNNNLTLGGLAAILDDKYGVFSDAVERGDNKQLNLITQELIKVFKGDDINARRIQNAAIAFIRNPIMRGDFGTNSKRTIGGKGFDWPMVDTGAFFTSIKAKVEQ